MLPIALLEWRKVRICADTEAGRIGRIKAMCDCARRLEKVNHSIQDVKAQIDRAIILAAKLDISMQHLDKCSLGVVWV